MIVVLVGFMGAGKTTVGRVLAERLGLPMVDSDLLIERRLGRSVADVFATEGEPYFRELEHRTIAELVRGQDAVLALGGGALGDRRTRAMLRRARVVYLHVGFAEAVARTGGDELRPMLRRPDLEGVYRSRLPVYEDLAAITVATSGRRPEAVAKEIAGRLMALPRLPEGSSSVFVTPPSGSYYSHIGPGLAEGVSELVPETPEAEQAAVIEADSDAATAAQVSAQLTARGLRVTRIAVPDGQAAKSPRAYGEVEDRLAGSAFRSGDLVVGVGGEHVCDLAGSVAARLNRGMGLVLVPTTLAAQADTAVGGNKAAVGGDNAVVGGDNAMNLSRGPNVAGSVRQPLTVISDVRLARRKAGSGFDSGLAEIAKHALISTSDLLTFLLANASAIREGDDDLLREVVSRSVEVKADIVSRDERDLGDRIFLNYGHTFAHAMVLVRPSAPGGGAVLSLGLMAAAHLAYRQGRVGADVVDTHRELLRSLGLRTHGSYPFDAMHQAWLRDEKFRHGIRFVVLNGIGRPEGGVAASEATLARVLHDLAAESVPAR